MRLTRLRHIFRFLPNLIKESLFPAQITKGKTYVCDGSILVYYRIGNRVIYKITSAINVFDVFRNKIVELRQIDIKDSTSIEDLLKTLSAKLETTQLLDKISVSEETSYKCAKWTLRQDIMTCNIIDQFSYVSSNRAVNNFKEFVSVTDAFRYEVKKRVTKSISESILLVEQFTSPTTGEYGAGIYERHYYLIRDDVIVTDQFGSGFPSSEYPGKTQIFRMVFEKIFPMDFQFQWKRSLLKKEEEEDAISLSDKLITKVFYITKVNVIDTVNVSDSIRYEKYVYYRPSYTELINLNERFVYYAGKLIDQSLTKVTANILLEHEQVIDYISESLDKSIARVELDHELIISYVDQSVTKEISSITFNSS